MPFTQKTKQQYAGATGADQALYLRAGLKHSQTSFAHLLFCYCVNEYKGAATKKKALFIWDRFLSGIGTLGLGQDALDMNRMDLGVDECGNPAVMPPIKSWIDTLRDMRVQAVNTNRIVRFFTTADRMAPPHLFDDFVKTMLARSGDTSWKDIVGRLHNDKIEVPMLYTKFCKMMPGVKAELLAAGFARTALAVPIGS